MKNQYPSPSKLIAFLNGQLPQDQSEEVTAWFNQNDETKKELAQLEVIWGLNDRLDQMEKIDKQAAKNKIDSRLKPLQSQWKIFVHSFQRVAAILILPILLLTSYLLFQYAKPGTASQEIVAAFGTRSSLVLPDGSKVWLNSGSKLSYGKDFNKAKRTVHLDGEAFFEVAANKSKPFDVVTPVFTVRAVGTEFNVFSYDEDEFETSLEKGITQLFRSGQKQDSQPLHIMAPGQRAVFNKAEGKLKLTETDVKQFSSWREGKLTFKDTPMNEVIMKLRRWFNIDIELKDTRLLQYRYTAVFENETIQQVMEMLRFSSPITYKIIPGEKRPDNTWAKTKIEIESLN